MAACRTWLTRRRRFVAPHLIARPRVGWPTFSPQPRSPRPSLTLSSVEFRFRFYPIFEFVPGSETTLHRTKICNFRNGFLTRLFTADKADESQRVETGRSVQ